ncbi:hypothetical protein LOTGIDRAFT_231625 [Lottia gigantea]|uniref:Uncharacterized protein n=1 Tax=Lottia gigantea TaxID=225164 RepID=V4ARK8_LOTGI|nr:hypothetical protein LOTGIDRAFT_231625 [Lottia gigantea]ESO97470.1 hypothetical protein LOTGIDRAFT_231625 [Lottia gigantea]
MAAEMNIFPKNGLFIAVKVFLLCNIVQITLCATTSPPSSPAAGTTNPQTTPVPTTQSSTPAQVQTTSIPTATPSPIPSNTDLAYCPCDLTGNSCDVNCCCDTDCSNDDRLAFSECLPSSVSTDDKLCMRSELILFDNSPYVANYTSNNLFCLYFDNNVERNYYNVPDLVTTEATFNSYVKDYGDFSFQSAATPKTVYSDYYKSGDNIYVVYDSKSQGILALPTALTSTYCTDNNPTAYLYDGESECVRKVTDLPSQCTSLPALSANSYYDGFRVVTSPVLFKEYQPDDNSTTEEEVGSITDLYNNTYTIPIEIGSVRCKDETTGLIANCSLSLPNYNTVTQTCENTVLQTGYNIKHNGTKGIKSVTVDFLLGTISTSNTQLISQSYFTKFTGEFEDNAFVRSGNPGYVNGEPVMAGILNNTVDSEGIVQQEIMLNSNRDQWLTIQSNTGVGDCLPSNRLSVVFGEDVRSGCFLQISLAGVADHCQFLQERIVQAVEGELAPIFAAGQYENVNRYVATFGNSDINKVGDWVPIQVQGRPIPAAAVGLRCSLSLGMNIQILYAKVGSLGNPQSKILGVAFVYHTPEDVNYRCIGPYCQPGTDLSQKLEIITSVSFIDVSQPPEGFEAEQPMFLAKVPYDFFYPFLTDTSSQLNTLNLCLVIVCLFVSLLKL